MPLMLPTTTAHGVWSGEMRVSKHLQRFVSQACSERKQSIFVSVVSTVPQLF